MDFPGKNKVWNLTNGFDSKTATLQNCMSSFSLGRIFSLQHTLAGQNSLSCQRSTYATISLHIWSKCFDFKCGLFTFIMNIFTQIFHKFLIPTSTGDHKIVGSRALSCQPFITEIGKSGFGIMPKSWSYCPISQYFISTNETLILARQVEMGTAGRILHLKLSFLAAIEVYICLLYLATLHSQFSWSTESWEQKLRCFRQF